MEKFTALVELPRWDGRMRATLERYRALVWRQADESYTASRTQVSLYLEAEGERHIESISPGRCAARWHPRTSGSWRSDSTGPAQCVWLV